MKLTELIACAPWREAVTYRDTWPHEYVLSEKDGQRELLDTIYARFRNGEGVTCRFFHVSNKYLFIGDFKYWFNSQWDGFTPDGENVINRARLYRDRQDFVIQPGDTGKPEGYPTNPAHQNPESRLLRSITLPQESALLAYLVPRLTNRVEDTATDALAFILNKSPACRDALGLLLREGEGSYQLDALASFDTQVTYKDGSRPGHGGL